MIDKSRLFEGQIKQDAEGSLYAIFNLCKVGIAANESAMAVDMGGANETLYEAIAALAEDGLERIEIERSERKMNSTPQAAPKEATPA